MLGSDLIMTVEVIELLQPLLYHIVAKFSKGDVGYGIIFFE